MIKKRDKMVRTQHIQYDDAVNLHMDGYLCCMFIIPCKLFRLLTYTNTEMVPTMQR